MIKIISPSREVPVGKTAAARQQLLPSISSSAKQLALPMLVLMLSATIVPAGANTQNVAGELPSEEENMITIRRPSAHLEN